MRVFFIRFLMCCAVYVLAGPGLTGSGLAGIAAAPASAAEAQRGPSKDGPRKYALLVGISNYPNKPLYGPKNDLALVWDRVRGRLGFEDKHITVLSDAVAKLPTTGVGQPAADALKIDGPPTAKRILDELKRILSIARKGDLVLFYFSGHGSYFPDDGTVGGTGGGPGSGAGKTAGKDGDAEVHGMDQLLLAIDYAAKGDKLENAISDDQLRQVFSSTDADIWLLIDACHAGDLTRGADTRTRSVDPIRDMGFKPSAFPAGTFANMRSTDGRAILRRPLRAQWVPANERRTISFAAVSANALAIERPISARGRVHGVFTHAFIDAIDAAVPATYRGLAFEISKRLQSLDPALPLPVYEGLLDQPFLSKTRVNAWEVQVTGDGKVAVERGGMLDGIDAGAILAIEPGAAGSPAQQAITYIEIEKAELASSVGKLIDYDGVTAPVGAAKAAMLQRFGSTPHIARLVAAAAPVGKVNFSLKVTRPAKMTSDADGARAMAAAERLVQQTESGKGMPIDWQPADPEACGLEASGGKVVADLYLCYRGGHIELLPALIDLSDQRRPIPRVAIADMTADQTEEALRNALWTVVRRANLLRVAGAIKPNKELAAAVEIEMHIARGKLFPEGQTARKEELDCSLDAPRKPPAGPKDFDIANAPDLRHCDLLYVNVRNNGTKRLDLTLLYLDVMGGIQPFPINPRVMPGDALAEWIRVAIFSWCSEQVCPRGSGLKAGHQPIGTERLLVIAVEREDANASDTASFAYLAQSGLAAGLRERGVRGAADDRGALGGFEKLLKEAALSPTGMRGGAADYRNATIRTITWRLRPFDVAK